MDNVTHAALGIAAGIAVRRSGASLPAAALAGLLAAEGPDLDVFIRSAGDPLVSFRWHRHFTHSFVFAPVWALLAAWISAWFFRRRPDAPWRDLLLPAFAGALTHLLCDACTSYGTMLLWPFDHGRYAWDCLPIVDLFATLPLLGLAIMAWKKAAPRLAVYGLAWFTAYALLGSWQHARAEDALRQWFASQNVTRRTERVAVKPTAFNLVVWRCVWLESGRWHTAAVRVMPFAQPQVIVGETRAALTPASPGLPPAGSPDAVLIADFSRFTQGWNSHTVDGSAVLVGDIRFGMLPTSARPLWSVRVEPSVPGTVIMDRSLRPGDWGRFGQMIAGTHPDYVTLK
jgi:inner membrane protein